jgi:hypothetical protein
MKRWKRCESFISWVKRGNGAVRCKVQQQVNTRQRGYQLTQHALVEWIPHFLHGSPPSCSHLPTPPNKIRTLTLHYYSQSTHYSFPYITCMSPTSSFHPFLVRSWLGQADTHHPTKTSTTSCAYTCYQAHNATVHHVLHIALLLWRTWQCT